MNVFATLDLDREPGYGVKQMSQLLAISFNLNSTLDLDLLLQYIIETAASVLDCEAASILLLDDRSGELRFAAATGSDAAKLAAIPVPLDRSIAGTIFLENRPLVIPNVDRDPRHNSTASEKVSFQPRTLLGVPLPLQGRNIGVLEALNRREGDFTETDIHLLTVIASQAAVAIQNARLMQSLRQAYEELSRVDQIKSSFLTLLSHELRTPLTAILGYASILKEESDGLLLDHTQEILTAATEMGAVLEATTRINVLRSGSDLLELRQVPAQHILHAVQEIVAPSLEAKGQTLLVDEPDESILAEVDASKLEYALLCLFQNAIRFTPPDGLIRVALGRDGNDLLLEVQDDGIGLAEEDLARIFDEFYQVEDHMTRSHRGLGLGLTLARAIVQLHEGELWAESEGLGHGATFKIRLPIEHGPTSKVFHRKRAPSLHPDLV